MATLMWTHESGSGTYLDPEFFRIHTKSFTTTDISLDEARVQFHVPLV